MFGGENSAVVAYFAPQFAPAQLPARRRSPSCRRPAIVLLFVLAGFGDRVVRYATARPRRPTRSSGCAKKSVRTPAFLVNSVLLRRHHRSRIRAHVAVARHARSRASWIPMSSTAPFASSPPSRAGLGTLVRSFETGLVRAYALILAFGAACFIVYYALAGGGPH